MRFDLDLVRPVHLEQVTEPGGRYYVLPDGTKYFSTTTILGDVLPHSPELDAWRKAVGAERADLVLRTAGRRGTAIHDLAERYVLGEEDWSRGAMPVNLHTFKSIRPQLDQNLGRVRVVEGRIYSRELRMAGTNDLCAEWAGVPSVIDFKTSRRQKGLKDIGGYLLQVGCYGIMLEETYEIQTEQAVILMAVDNETEPQVFVRPIEPLKAIARKLLVNRSSR